MGFTEFRGSIPRARGDGPVSITAALEAAEVFPAHAGMDRKARRSSIKAASIPRARGDGPTGERRVLKKD